jgi:hypothetical protein
MYKYLNSTSDLGQESYVLTTLKEQKNGYYVELGSGDPISGSNTLLLERKYGWTGLALELNKHLAEEYNSQRANKCVAADALTFNYEAYFEENNFPKEIDYLQIDIDGHDEGRCLLALLALPMLKYRFKVITIEHDLVVNFKREPMRNAQREILHSLGYTLTAQLDGEDWWVDKNLIPLEKDEQLPTYMRNPYFYGER